MPTSSLRPGDPQQLGSYEILGRLGAGGQGVVYLGQSPDDGERVAIKVLHYDVDEAFLLRELTMMRQVASFCTARVLDAQVTGSTWYIVSEYIDGRSLADVVDQDGPITGGSLERLAIGTVTALTAIHQAGVVHRDFKPANILLGPDGPRVIDFGIARTLDLTITAGEVRGTPAYMAPEQINGQVAGTAADMFAWAATMAFAATGRSPFGSDTLAAIIMRVLQEQPDLHELTGALHDVTVACLAKDQAARPTAQETLIRLLGHTPAAPVQALHEGTTLAASTSLPSTASISPPSTASTSPPSTASTSPPSTASTSPPSTASTSPPSTASTSPPSTASTSPPSTASTSPPSTAAEVEAAAASLQPPAQPAPPPPSPPTPAQAPPAPPTQQAPPARPTQQTPPAPPTRQAPARPSPPHQPYLQQQPPAPQAYQPTGGPPPTGYPPAAPWSGGGPPPAPPRQRSSSFTRVLVPIAAAVIIAIGAVVGLALTGAFAGAKSGAAPSTTPTSRTRTNPAQTGPGRTNPVKTKPGRTSKPRTSRARTSPPTSQTSPTPQPTSPTPQPTSPAPEPTSPSPQPTSPAPIQTSSPPATGNGPVSSIPPDFGGQWSGTGHQPGDAQTPTYTIAMSLSGGGTTGSTSYSSLGCQGQLTLMSGSTAKTLQLREQITSGSCTSTGVFTVHLKDGGLVFSYAPGGPGPASYGTLHS